MMEDQEDPAPAPDALGGGGGGDGRARLEAYVVGKAVGRGGYSIVYKGTRKADGRTVAIKKVEIFDMAVKKRERCLQEVQLLQSLTHPAIISMLDSFICDNELVIVFEWALGGDLKRVIRRQQDLRAPLDESVIWGHFTQVSGALRYMHSKRIMHRDVKPANVLVTATGLKLGDLGLGRHFSTNTNEAFSKVGTPYYVSPEVVRGEGYDWKSDVWSLGCLLYELAALRSPFEMEGANLMAVFKKISVADFEPLKTSQHSSPLVHLVSSMLQIDPASRPEMEEVDLQARAALEHQARGLGDVVLLSEHVHDQLCFLGSEVKRFKEKFRLGASLLRVVTPHYFAADQPGAAPGAQFTSFALIAAWLLLLNGRKGASVEEELEAILGLSEERPPVPDKPGQSKQSGQHSREGSGRGLEWHTAILATSPAVEARRQLASKLLHEATRVGVPLVQYAPAAALSCGYGWAVCQLLSSLLDTTLIHLKIRSRAAVHVDAQVGAESIVGRGSSSPEALATACVDTGLEGTWIMEGIGVSWISSTHNHEHEEPDRDGDRMGRGVDEWVGPESRELPRAGSAAHWGPETEVSTSFASVHKSLASAMPIFSQVSEEAWRAEAARVEERLRGPSLGGAEGHDSWLVRVTRLVALSQKYHSTVGGALHAAQRLHSSLSNDLNGVKKIEERMHLHHEELIIAYAQRCQQLHEARQQFQAQQEQVSERSGQLSELAEAISRLQYDRDSAGDIHNGSKVLGHVKSAILNLNRELKRMEIQIALGRNRLMKRELEVKNSLDRRT